MRKNVLHIMMAQVFFVALLIPSSHSFAQTTIGQVENQFDFYRTQALQEKIFVHTDKNLYQAGEICWFKIYYVDGFFHQPADISKVAYVEIIDKTNHPVLQAKIGLKEGNGNGSLNLPVTLNSGNYIIRAYTNWMKNFGAPYFFEKNLTIINAQKVQEVKPPQPLQYDIQFFPEGGNLVNGIQSSVGFRITDQYGRGVDATAILVDDRNDTVLTFKPFKFGIGRLSFTPVAGRTYNAVLSIPGTNNITKPLPQAFNQGYVMHCTHESRNELKISVQSNSDLNGEIYLFAHTRGSVKLATASRMQNGVASFTIDRNILGDGISHLTVFNASRQPVCERLHFKYPQEKLQLGLSVNQQAYETRKKITIDISATENQKPAASDLSIAVYLLDSLQSIDKTDITSYLLLCSDLTGPIESPEYYLDASDGEREEAVDNLMLTHGWRRFRWEEVIQNSKPAFAYLPEYYGHIVNGRVVDTRTGQPASQVNAFLSVPGIRTQFRPSVSDISGRVKFELKDFAGTQELIVQTNTMKDSFYRVEISNPFFDKYSSAPLPDFTLPRQNPGTLLDQSINAQVQNIYTGAQLKQFRPLAIDTNAFYTTPDYSYLLDNYVRFTTMEEVLREYVLPVNVRKSRGEFHLPVYNQPFDVMFAEDPLVLLDGVPVFDLTKWMSYDPLKIRKLDVLSRQYFLGNLSFNGVINFNTYAGDLSGLELDPRVTVLDYEGLQMQREFFSPVYETEQQENSRLPDFRNVLYWSPEIKTDAQGKKQVNFYSSDLPGRYAAVIQGITKNGKTGSNFIYFQVNEKQH